MVDRMAPGDVVSDTGLRGFGVRRQLGVPVYFLRKKINGRDRWMAIGPHGSPWTVDSARKEALRLLGSVAAGDDPQQRRKPERNPTIADAVDLFMDEHGRKLKPTTFEKYRILFTNHIVPAIGDLRVSELARPDVLRLHARIARLP